MDLREIGLEAANWINLTQNRDQWRGLVKKVMNLGGLLLGFQEGLYSME
jgi:hypothetical protein